MNVTLDELVERSTQVLDALDVLATSGRVRDRPDRRTIRYYCTLGLVDPPLDHRGRVAHYGDRHLLQVVVIKRLQAQGSSLADLQQHLVGASTRRLQDLAGPGYDAAVGAITATNPTAPPTASRAAGFWLTPPAGSHAVPMGEGSGGGRAIRGGATAAHRLLSIPLGHDIVVTVSTDVAAEQVDVAALRRAAAPLLTTLFDMLGRPAPPHPSGEDR